MVVWMSKISKEKIDELKKVKVGKRISECRKAFGYTLRDLAEKIGFNYVTISKWEHNLYVPCNIALDRMTLLFDLPADFFDDVKTERKEKRLNAMYNARKVLYAPQQSNNKHS